MCQQCRENLNPTGASRRCTLPWQSVLCISGAVTEHGIRCCCLMHGVDGSALNPELDYVHTFIFNFFLSCWWSIFKRRKSLKRALVSCHPCFLLCKDFLNDLLLLSTLEGSHCSVWKWSVTCKLVCASTSTCARVVIFLAVLSQPRLSQSVTLTMLAVSVLFLSAWAASSSFPSLLASCFYHRGVQSYLTSNPLLTALSPVFFSSSF